MGERVADRGAAMVSSSRISGSVLKLGDNINTDVIIPARYLISIDPEELGKHALEPLGAEVQERLWKAQIVVAGRNFGCGSAREQAALCLIGAGIRAVVAHSFARVFFRNCINTGLVAVECPEAASYARDGDVAWIDIEAGKVHIRDRLFAFAPYPDTLRMILKAGGIIPYLAKYVLSNTSVPSKPSDNPILCHSET